MNRMAIVRSDPDSVLSPNDSVEGKTNSYQWLMGGAIGRRCKLSHGPKRTKPRENGLIFS